MAAHTPGPWAIIDGGDYEHENYVENWLAIIPAAEANKEYDDVKIEIARVGSAYWRFHIRHRDIDEEIDEANARLIAAAPEMLAALEKLANPVRYLPGASAGPLWVVGYGEARAGRKAIAQARGGSDA